MSELTEGAESASGTFVRAQDLRANEYPRREKINE